MSFDRTKANVERFTSKEEICLDDLLGAIRDLRTEVLEKNDNYDLTSMKLSDNDDDTKIFMVESAYILGDLLVTVFKSQRESVSLIDEAVRSEYDSLVNELNEVFSAIKSTHDEIEKEKKKKEELDIKRSDLAATRAPLITIRDECDSIQREIDELSDESLNDIEAIRDKLKKELESRQKTRKDLVDSIEGLEKDIEGIEKDIERRQGEIDKLNHDIDCKKEELSKLKLESDELLERKNGYEKGIENQKNAIERDRKLLDEYQNISGKLGEEREQLTTEKKARIAVINNALLSIFNDNFLRETLYHIPGTSDNLAVENYPDYAVSGFKTFNDLSDVQTFVKSLEERADSLIDIMTKILQTLVSASESITKEN